MLSDEGRSLCLQVMVDATMHHRNVANISHGNAMSVENFLRDDGVWCLEIGGGFERGRKKVLD